MTFVDHGDEVRATIRANVEEALQAMGAEAVARIVGRMEGGYGSPVRLSGDLQRDVGYAPGSGEQTIDVGNSLGYAVAVHEGTSRMGGRPYIRDALCAAETMGALQSIAEACLGRGF